MSPQKMAGNTVMNDRAWRSWRVGRAAIINAMVRVLGAYGNRDRELLTQLGRLGKISHKDE